MTFSEPVAQVIKRRYSCRTYLAEPIDADKRQKLIEWMGSLPPGPFGNRGRFMLAAATAADHRSLRGLGTYEFIKGATGFLIGAIEKSTGRNLEDFGYQMETIILQATALGLGTCWLGGTFTKSSFARKILIRENELVPAVAAIGRVAGKPRWIEKMIRRGASAERRLSWENLFFENSFEKKLSKPAAGAFAEPLEMVRLGPSASNQQPWRVVKTSASWQFYLIRTPGYRERALVRFFTVADMQRMDMGIAMCHFEFTARELGLQGAWAQEPFRAINSEPGIEYTASWMVDRD